AKPPGPRDYVGLESEAALDEWLERIPVGQPVAVAAGDMMAETVMGFSAEPGVARSAARAKVPVRATASHDLKALMRPFCDALGLEHDVMLYGFLLSADPGACDLQALAERYLEESLDAGPAAHADAILKLFCKLGPLVEQAN